MYEKKWFLRLDTKKQYDNEVITMVRQDTYSNVLYIVLYHEQNKLILDDIITIAVIIDKPDNTQVIGSAEILNDSTVRYVVDYQALTALGLTKFTLKLIKEDNILTTTSFVVNVISDPFAETDGSIESTSEYPILTNLILGIGNIIETEDIRVQNENQRLENEETRIDNENERIANENIRKSNEITRQSNETTRQNNETNRNTKETERQTNETTRQSNETARQSAETLRNIKETTREENEDIRKTNETNRLSAETTRNTNETTRQNNETTRQSNETTREDNEQLRVQLYNDLMAQLDRIEQIQQQVPENILQNIGDLTTLTTDDKTSLVNAINEVNADVANLDLSTINQRFDIIDTDINNLETSITQINTDVGNLESSISTINTDITTLENTVDSISTELENKVVDFTGVLENTSWTGTSAPYTKTVTVTGISSTGKPPVIDITLSTTWSTALIEEQEWAKIKKIEYSNDTLTFYADEVPTITLNFKGLQVN